MAVIYGDLHIHIGRTSHGDPVKITASPQLSLANLPNIAKKKGLGLLGIVDAATKGVLCDLKRMHQDGELVPLPGGGYRWQGLTLLLGHEVELAHRPGKVAHFLAYFPDLHSLQNYAARVSSWMTNSSLSTQKVKVAPDLWLQEVVGNGGVCLAAHAFTPHKGVYGNCVRALGDMFSQPQLITGLELGLSANTDMALQVTDTHGYAYVSNSDAHSLATVAREFTAYDLPEANFEAWVQALDHQGQGIVATYGLEPLLGKYHRSFCNRCQLVVDEDHPVFQCPHCNGPMILGVWDRLADIRDLRAQPPPRPPYRAHVPLLMLSGVGPKTYEELTQSLGTEIDILYTVNLENIAHVAGLTLAAQIEAVRLGLLPISPGGGGKYGRVTKVKETRENGVNE